MLGPHRIRHSHLTHLAEKGLPLRALQHCSRCSGGIGFSNNKLFVPFEAGADTYALTLALRLDAAAAGKTAEVSHCELTRVR
jgi:hypothetical protein